MIIVGLEEAWNLAKVGLWTSLWRFPAIFLRGIFHQVHFTVHHNLPGTAKSALGQIETSVRHRHLLVPHMEDRWQMEGPLPYPSIWMVFCTSLLLGLQHPYSDIRYKIRSRVVWHIYSIYCINIYYIKNMNMYISRIYNCKTICI